jgi:hypothetical protein
MTRAAFPSFHKGVRGFPEALATFFIGFFWLTHSVNNAIDFLHVSIEHCKGERLVLFAVPFFDFHHPSE